jgi:Rad3-related DNA helicase
VTRFQQLYGENPTFEECNVDNPEECAVSRDCGYLIAKRNARISKARILNYHYAYYARWWRSKPEPGIVVCDEAHGLPTVIASLSSMEVTETTRAVYDLPTFVQATGSTRTEYDKIVDWIERSQKALESWKMMASMTGGDERQIARVDRLYAKLETTRVYLQACDEHDWYVASGIVLGRVSVRPVFAKEYAPMILEASAKGFILMSATIGDPSIIASELGIEDYEFISLPHIIPEEQRPVFFSTRAPRINFKSTDIDYLQQADIIRNIIHKHVGQRGVIHTVSWRHARKLAELLADTGRIMLAEGKRVATVKRFRQSPLGTVAISPSWGEGLDFRGDQAEFSVVAKIYFLPIKDPIVAMRLKSKGGKAWYDWHASLGVVQACGRTVRGIDDYGTAYIVDGNWPRVSRYAPQWFTPIDA